MTSPTRGPRSWAALLIVTLVSATGCGLLGSEEDRAAPAPTPSVSPSLIIPPSGEPVPPVEGDLPAPVPLEPEPPADAPELDKILWALGDETVTVAGMAMETAQECDVEAVDGNSDQTLECTVEYAGQTVPYTVTIEGSEELLFEYELSTTQGVLLRPVVLAEFAGSAYYDPASDPRCDLPEATLVDLNVDSGFACTFRQAGTGERAATAITLTPYGIDFTLV